MPQLERAGPRCMHPPGTLNPSLLPPAPPRPTDPFHRVPHGRRLQPRICRPRGPHGRALHPRSRRAQVGGLGFFGERRVGRGHGAVPWGVCRCRRTASYACARRRAALQLALCLHWATPSPAPLPACPAALASCSPSWPPASSASGAASGACRARPTSAQRWGHLPGPPAGLALRLGAAVQMLPLHAVLKKTSNCPALQAVVQLIRDCTAREPGQRPPAAEVLRRLQEAG